jgi:galactokinase
MALAHIGGHHMLTPTDFALIAQQSENAFVGTACGIMDQLVSARAENASALMIDCRSLNCAPVPMPDDVAVLIVHSGVERELADSAYNERRLQCEAVAAHFGVKALRDISLEQLLAAQNTLDETAFRRAHHVVTENARVLQAAKALADNDLATMGRLMAQSHISMRDDFAITVPKIDSLVALLQEAIGPQGGARMTGGGFGGCVVAMMRKDTQESVKAHITEHYTAPSGNAPQIFAAMPSAGAHIL